MSQNNNSVIFERLGYSQSELLYLMKCFPNETYINLYSGFLCPKYTWQYRYVVSIQTWFVHKPACCSSTPAQPGTVMDESCWRKELCNVLYSRYVKHKVSHLQFIWLMRQVKSPHVSSLEEEPISGSWKAVSLKDDIIWMMAEITFFNAFSSASGQGSLILHCGRLESISSTGVAVSTTVRSWKCQLYPFLDVFNDGVLKHFPWQKKNRVKISKALALEDSVIWELYENSQATGGVVMGSLDKNTMMNMVLAVLPKLLAPW